MHAAEATQFVFMRSDSLIQECVDQPDHVLICPVGTILGRRPVVGGPVNQHCKIVDLVNEDVRLADVEMENVASMSAP